MAISVSTFPSHSFCITIYSARVTIDDLIEGRRLLQADPDFDPDMSELQIVQCDVMVDVSVGELREHAKRSPLFSESSRRVILVQASDLAFGSARLFEMEKADAAGSILVTRDLEQAGAFLGIPIEQLSDRLLQAGVSVSEA